MLIGGGVVLTLYVMNYLSAVLLPFFIAWLLAYLLYPLVVFIQHRLKLKVRSLSIVLAMVLVLAVLAGVVMLVIPPMIDECSKFSALVTNYIKHAANIKSIPEAVQWWINDNADDIQKFLTSENFASTVKETMPQVFTVMGKTMRVVMSIVASCITLLYTFFILQDYEYLSKNWIKIFPEKNHAFCHELMNDVKKALNNYLRGQGLVALTMGILFCIGFSIIGLPMAIGLGILIGIMDLVPYLHTLGMIPAFLLAAMDAAENGDNVWTALLMVVIVFAVVQLIIESIVNPKILGKTMNMNPAVLLLSLSIWGSLLGMIGLIIALPATTIIMAYWKRYITENKD